MNSFAHAHGKNQRLVFLVKYLAYAKCEIKSTHRRSDFTRAMQKFHPPARLDLVEKDIFPFHL